jgi:hypothetical protein
MVEPHIELYSFVRLAKTGKGQNRKPTSTSMSFR